MTKIIGKRELQWITESDGKRILGPFESVDLAIQVREYVEVLIVP